MPMYHNVVKIHMQAGQTLEISFEHPDDNMTTQIQVIQTTKSIIVNELERDVSLAPKRLYEKFFYVEKNYPIGTVLKCVKPLGKRFTINVEAGHIPLVSRGKLCKVTAVATVDGNTYFTLEDKQRFSFNVTKVNIDNHFKVIPVL